MATDIDEGSQATAREGRYPASIAEPVAPERLARDDSRLDTLFLAMPVSWRGTLQQYVGRLHRIHEGKKVVRCHDYVDAQVPMLA